MCYDEFNKILQLKDRGAVVKSNHRCKACKAVAVAKGAAAEGGMVQIPPGHTENIRLTVAFAESYGLIVNFFRKRKSSTD